MSALPPEPLALLPATLGDPASPAGTTDLAGGENVPAITVEFRYYPGLSADPFTAVTLLGSWDATGAPSDGPWSAQAMRRVETEDGSIGYAAAVSLDDAAVGRVIQWGVQVQKRRPD